MRTALQDHFKDIDYPVCLWDGQPTDHRVKLDGYSKQFCSDDCKEAFGEWRRGKEAA